MTDEVPSVSSHEPKIDSHVPEEEPSAGDSKASLTDPNGIEMLPTVKSKLEANDPADEQTSSFKVNRDLLRKNISQHVHITLKPYTKRTCKQRRIVSTEDIKYLVKKFTLAVLDKEIEKAKNDGLPLAPILTDRVRSKTELYVKKCMNKVGAVFQRYESAAAAAAGIVVHPPASSNPEWPLQSESRSLKERIDVTICCLFVCFHQVYLHLLSSCVRVIWKFHCIC